MSMKIAPVHQQLPSAYLPKTQRALLMLKPDGVAYFQEAIYLISRTLSNLGINFRIILPALTSVSPEFAKLLYTEEGLRFDNHRCYMSSGFSDPRVVSSPVITMVIEAESREGFNLIQTLRRTDVIGPTNLEKALSEADASERLKIEQSIRYKLVFGEKARIWPLPKLENGPMYNRIHCSASDVEATREVGVFNAGRYLELNWYYDEQSIQELHRQWPIQTDIQQRLVRTPLLLLFENSEAIEFLQRSYAGFNYRHFGEQECFQLAMETNQVIPMLLQLAGHFIEHLDRANLSIFDLGRFSRRYIGPSSIVLVCGDTGSGKTSLVQALYAQSYKPIVLHTSRERKDGETEGVDYFFRTPGEMLDGIAQGKFLGVDRVGNDLYGVSRDILYAKGNFVFASGPNTLAGMRASLPPEVKFGGVFVDCSPEVLVQRLISRARETGAKLQARIDRVKGTKQRYAPRLAEFDLIVNNDAEGGLDSIVAQIRAFAADLEAGKVSPKQVALSAYKMTPQRRVVQYLFDRCIIEYEATIRQKIGPGPVDSLSAKINELFKRPYELFVSELLKDYHDKPYLNEDDQRKVSKIIVPHVLNTYLITHQIFHPWEIVNQSPKRLGRFWEYGESERIAKNLARARIVFESIPDIEKALILFAHDIGKVVDFAGHQMISADLINAYNLFEFVDGISPERKKLICLFIKYHQNVADYAYAFMSWQTAVIDMFNDKDARSLFCRPDGSVDIEAIKLYLDRHKFMSVCDVAGSLSPKGGLRNINFELYYEIIDNILDVFVHNASSYDRALQKLIEIGKESPLDQLAGMLFAFDPISDQRKEGKGYYKQLILESKDRAVAAGLFSQNEWEAFLQISAFIDNKYCPHLWWIYFGPSPERPTEGEDRKFYVTPEQPPVSIWNAYIMMSRIIREVVPNFGSQMKVLPTYYDRDGVDLSGRAKELDAAWEEHAVFDQARSYKIDGNTVTFLDGNGIPLEGVKIKIIPGDKTYTLRYEHYNLSYSNASNLEF